MAIFSEKRYFNDILWTHACNNNKLLLAAIRYTNTWSTAKGKRKRSHFFLKLHISNVNNLCFHESWNGGVIFKCTDDHIFEKTMTIELSPIP